MPVNRRQTALSPERLGIRTYPAGPGSAEGSRSKAAESLGIDRTTLYKKMVSYGILKVKKKRESLRFEKRTLLLH